jgi:hypothetical protein
MHTALGILSASIASNPTLVLGALTLASEEGSLGVGAEYSLDSGPTLSGQTLGSALGGLQYSLAYVMPAQ